MLIALKEKCKENAKHLPSAPSSRQDGVRERDQQGEKGKTKTESAPTPFSFWARSVKCNLKNHAAGRVYHQFRRNCISLTHNLIGVYSLSNLQCIRGKIPCRLTLHKISCIAFE